MKHPLLKKLKSQNAPLLDGDRVTFVWRGAMGPKLIGDFNDWEDDQAIQLTKVAPKLWVHQMSFPSDAYIEYSYIQGEERLADPYNPCSTPNGVGGRNSYFFMPEAAPTPLASCVRKTPHGIVTRHLIGTEGFIWGDRRSIYLYRPALPGPYPLVVVWDGSDYLRRAKLVNIFDNLIAQERIRPVALAMIPNGGKARTIEYACSEATLGFLLGAVLPKAHQNLDLIDLAASPGAYGVMGASMGGLMALYTGLRLPNIFGRVLSQSGSFSFDDFDLVVYDLINGGPFRPLKIWMDVGRFDFSGLLSTNRRMAGLLSLKNYSITYREYHGGHNYSSWRDDLWRGLEHLFGFSSEP
jgi:enterochelin esterase-like enzyme